MLYVYVSTYKCVCIYIYQYIYNEERSKRHLQSKEREEGSWCVDGGAASFSLFSLSLSGASSVVSQFQPHATIYVVIRLCNTTA